jgi:transposase
MVYTSPTKVARVDFKKLSMGNEEIAQRIGIHHTTVTCILKCLEKSEDLYYVNPKTGRPHKMDVRKIQVAAQMLAKTEAANATEIMKKAFLEVLCPLQ